MIALDLENSKSNSRRKVNKWFILIIVVMATFMATLDSSIVNVAMPTMSHLLGVTTSAIQLVATSYLVVITGSVLVFGKLGDMFGKAEMFILGLFLFTFGSLLCGLTNSFYFLILARIVQAIGAAGTMANNQGIITEIFEPGERGKALGFVGTAVALGALVGPGLGGMIVGVFSWKLIFLINVPIGIVVIICAIKLLPKEKKIGGRLDVLGALLFMITIVSLFLSLTYGLERGFTDTLILTGFFISALSFITFLFLETKRKNPLIDLKIFKNSLFSLSIFCGFITFVAIFCSNIILPFYLQNVCDYSPQKAGLILMIYPLFLTVIAPLSGYLSDKIGSEILTFLGLAITSLGLFFMSTLTEGTHIILLAAYIIMMSVGMGLFQSPNNSLVMSTVSKDKLGVAGSVNALVRNLGMVCGITLATTLLYSRMSHLLGYRVLDFVEGRNDVFISGMELVYLVAAAINSVGAMITLIRLIKNRKLKIQ